MPRNNNNNSNNQRERKPGMPGDLRSSDERNYSPPRSSRERNDQRVSSINRLDLRRSDRENDLYERQSI
jgi:hypothetical protein